MSSPSSSSSSSSCSSSPDFQLYRDRPEWHDVSPQQQDDGRFGIVSIAYSDRFKDTFDYFRAILQLDEMSERALQLTKDCISLNPSNYTIWYFRRKVLKALHKDLFEEISYLDEVIKDNAKNYQVWHHRKCIIEWIKENCSQRGKSDDSLKEQNHDNNFGLLEVIQHEKKFIASMISQDSKNYHAWQHRQWVVNEFAAWNDELDYTQELIEDDIRNNSAWNHRYFVISKTTGFTDSVVESEVDFVCKKIYLAPNNESSWNYLRGILKSKGLNSNEKVTEIVKELVSRNDLKSPHLLAFAVDQMEEQMSGQDPVEQTLLSRALQLCNELATNKDVMRKEYWNFVARQLNDNYGQN